MLHLPLSLLFHNRWRPIAQLILNACFEATILVAAIKALKQDPTGNKRVRVFLTAVGAGVFQNAISWVSSAIERAVRKWFSFSLPVDIIFVHYGSAETKPFDNLNDIFPKKKAHK
jgi:hypothetical protein